MKAEAIMIFSICKGACHPVVYIVPVVMEIGVKIEINALFAIAMLSSSTRWYEKCVLMCKKTLTHV
jgi:hypothetical protein